MHTHHQHPYSKSLPPFSLARCIGWRTHTWLAPPPDSRVVEEGWDRDGRVCGVGPKVTVVDGGDVLEKLENRRIPDGMSGRKRIDRVVGVSATSVACCSRDVAGGLARPLHGWLRVWSSGATVL